VTTTSRYSLFTNFFLQLLFQAVRAQAQQETCANIHRRPLHVFRDTMPNLSNQITISCFLLYLSSKKMWHEIGNTGTLVSLGAILLSLYYILFWKNPHTQNLHLTMVSENLLSLNDDIPDHRLNVHCKNHQFRNFFLGRKTLRSLSSLSLLRLWLSLKPACSLLTGSVQRDGSDRKWY